MEPQKPVYRIRDLESGERPRERLARLGAEALSTAELLAILLRVGIPGENAVQLGTRLLKTFGGLGGLHRASLHELQAQHGVGVAKAAQIKAAIELGRRMVAASPEERPAIHSPADAAALVLYEMSALPQEHLWVILTDTRNRVMHIEKMYRGSLNASTVRVGEVFRAAIQRNAAAILVVHNHPSGDPTPSPEDIALTRALIQAGRLLDVEVLDHLVIGQGRFVSLKERGLAFS
ncbi:DNA repair protein RadC [uncultured Thermanaerothrix sp.]|uniref:RadC family protein n=1 Tax=uncultured Thermanaerothrix sp. TaxID=1195149 RepID=UPI0026029F60|nr:DNA repair protein RadC [uncultured Thermanaerothrix sp.]